VFCGTDIPLPFVFNAGNIPLNSISPRNIVMDLNDVMLLVFRLVSMKIIVFHKTPRFTKTPFLGGGYLTSYIKEKTGIFYYVKFYFEK
jgi:hypothetical protein